MTINAGVNALLNALKTSGQAIGTAICGASLGTLLKVGALIGAAAATIILTLKKLMQKRKLYKRQKAVDKKHAEKEQPVTVADFVNGDNYIDPIQRRDLDTLLDTMMLKRKSKAYKKTKAYKNLSKKDKRQMKAARKRMEQIILGDGYDPSIEYGSMRAAKAMLTIDDDIREAKARQRAENNRVDDKILWRIMHPTEVEPLI